MVVTRELKKYFLASILQCCTRNLKGWPRVICSQQGVKNSSDLRQLKPWMILKHVIKSHCSLRSSRRSNPRQARRSSYVSNDMPRNFLVKHRWTDSMELIIPTVCGDQTTLEYSRIGRAYVLKALTSISLSLLRNQRKIWLACLCALATIRFMCSTNVSLLSIEIPRSRTISTVFRTTSLIW